VYTFVLEAWVGVLTFNFGSGVNLPRFVFHLIGDENIFAKIFRKTFSAVNLNSKENFFAQEL
jgi:hypothetical protein